MVRDMHSDDPQQLELLRVCRIGRAQGLKGEVTVQIFTDEPEYRFAPGAVLYTKDGEEEYVVESSRTFKNRCKVVDVIEVAQWLLKIRLANPVKDADGVVVENSALVPFVDELVPDIDLEGGYLTLDPPGGLIPGL